jgi:hygromycin-B 4-O-kinase
MSTRQVSEAVRRIVADHLGGKPKRIDRQSGGLTNLVFSIEHDKGAFIIRLNPDHAKLNPFLKEQWASARAREVGVPVPRILEVGNDPLPFMILRKAEGESAAYHPERLQIVRELGRYAALINSIPTKGFGGTFDWSHNVLSHNPDWTEFLRSEVFLDDRLRLLKRLRLISAKQVKSLRATLDSACGKGRKPALNHGDLRLKNVLVNHKGRISAILDWENCTSNLAPEWELSLALHDLSIDEKEEFVFGYGLSARSFSAMAPVIKALNVINYVHEVERLARNKDSTQLEFYRLRLGGLFDLYSL